MSAHLIESIVIGVLVAILAVLLDMKWSQPTPPDADHLTPEQRAKAERQKRRDAMKERREAAVKWMQDNGIVPLTKGHDGGRTGWQKVNPMVAVDEQPEPAPANVVRMRGQR